MGQDRSRSFARNHRTLHVADRQCRRAFLLRLTLGRQRVRRFSGLTDANRKRLRIEDRIAIAKFAAVIDFHGNSRQPLNHELPGQTRVPTRPARDDAHIVEAAKLLLGNLHIVQKYFAGVLGNSPEQRVPDRSRLLENFLLHEMLVAALFRHDRIPGNLVSGPLHRVAFQVRHANAFPGQNRNIPIRQKENVPRVLQQGWNIAGHKIFAVAQADNRRRPNARRDQLLRILGRQKHQRIDSPQVLQRLANRLLSTANPSHISPQGAPRSLCPSR